MAGIAFRLQKLVKGESYSDLIRAYLYSAIISTGPFLVIIGTLGILKALIQTRLTIDEGQLLLSLIVYCYAFSMIAVSPFLYVVTRYLADKYYLKEIHTFTASYLSVLYTVFIVQSLISIPFIYSLDLYFVSKITLYCLFQFVGGIWIAMIYLSAGRSYLWIVGAFVTGGILGVILSSVLGQNYGFAGFLNGFGFGQGVIFLILTCRIFFEFGYASSHNFGFFSYFRSHPYLMLTGVFYYLGIWIDKFIFWFSPYADVIEPQVRVYTNYDTPMFLSYLTVVPSMAFFLVQMETSFVKYYNAYYKSVRERSSLNTIRSRRQDMIQNLSQHFQKYALFQGVFSFVVILSLVILLPNMVQGLHLNPYQTGIFRIGILGAFLLMGFLMILNIVFYFDFQRDAFLFSLVLFLTNTIATLVTLKIGYEAFGFGMTVSALITVIFAFYVLNKKLKDLDYWTFMH
ncbi:MAG: exopolysaccharide Pel transporter PelG, partial [Deltaproteobacteria bacterium]|nr:exopolysaccharide Pel transporter PelG [Deltaproteobacteria bacterium]